MFIPDYEIIAAGYKQQLVKLNARLNQLSILRLILFVLLIVAAYKTFQQPTPWGYITLGVLALFVIAVRWYDSAKSKKLFVKELVGINENEIKLLQEQPSMYDGGSKYNNTRHSYAYDLDIFGEGSLYQWLNRCSTSFGQDALAAMLTEPATDDIKSRQQAIQELETEVTYRQQLQAHGRLMDKEPEDLQKLKWWLTDKKKFIQTNLYRLLFVLPTATLIILVLYFATQNEQYLTIFGGLFTLNLIVSFSFGRIIASQLSMSTSVNKILTQYAQQLRLIENAKFESAQLQLLQKQLSTSGVKASAAIGRLAALFNYLETVVNLLVSILLNGLFLFHVHILYRIGKWKKQHATSVLPWLEIIGTAEALNSLANMGANNAGFCVPEIHNQPLVVAEEMGHPLISPQKRICNSISFQQEKFVILTGSNMSGKSTFLRTLGVNLVLAKTGARVCAQQFVFYPFNIAVSMRITDSLQENESFFYAELKRLHEIIESLQKGKSVFVILDEILRGTNSNDKHNGTIGLIQKLIRLNATGIIATHDVTVAQLTAQYPGITASKCFESEIAGDELIFDYKLKPGVCEKLSASFLMKKMGIIE